MSLESQVAQLSQNVGNLVNRVTTQANEWDAKVAQAVQTVNNFITNAKSYFDSREIRQFKVLGSEDLFYPVIFATAWKEPIVLQVFRRDIHTDGERHGSLFFELHYMPSNWGHEPSYLRLTKHLFYIKHFVARYTSQYRAGSLIVWLRGQTTYNWISTLYNTQVDYDATAKTIDFGVHGVDVYHVLNAVDTDLLTEYLAYGR